ncbi:hypothetical protein RclHR1_03610015 [Rhizophagus clarus]|uniref:BTB domain-containing protein n=1 Tax=Rhizophagus clarus TaxID=94130 RepID=A0A2Z6RRX6_9GLOM|nr:hypothetical protein RclHR1_03610015 [Rhizophagus clarus]
MTSNFLEELLYDYENLLFDGNDYDVIFEVGINGNIRRFHAHSLILSLRSAYFKAALSNNWIHKEDGMILLKKPNIDPKIMELILRYVYVGTIDLNNQKRSEVLKLYVTSDELYFWGLKDSIQTYIIKEQVNFLKDNPLEVLQTLFQYEPLTLLRDFFLKLICDQPETLFLTKNLVIEKSLLILIVQRGDLRVEEYNIWAYVLEWGVARMPYSLNINDLSNWTEENFIELGEILYDFITLIRWVQISPKLFYQKIFPFKRLFPEDIFDDIVGYYMDPDSLPKSMILLQPRKPSFSSEIINKEHFAIISGWIDKEMDYEIKNIPYSFELLYSATKDGFDSTKFHELCGDKGPTLIIAKIKDTGRLIGGYNPGSWKFNTISDNYFLFSFVNKDNVNSPIIARCADHLNGYSSVHYSGFIDLFDLTIKNNILECNSTCSFPGISSFINVCQKFSIEDYEVFKVTKLSKLINNEEITKSKINLATEFMDKSIAAKHEIEKISSIVKFTFQRCIKILVNAFESINSIMILFVQRCSNFIFQVYSIMKFIFQKCSDIVFQFYSIIKFKVQSFISQVYSTIKYILQDCAKILINTIKIIFQSSSDIVFQIYSIIFRICITIIFQSYSIIKFIVNILYIIFQKDKIYSVIKLMSTVAIFQGCANITTILYKRDEINSIVKFASNPIFTLTNLIKFRFILGLVIYIYQL